MFRAGVLRGTGRSLRRLAVRAKRLARLALGMPPATPQEASNHHEGCTDHGYDDRHRACLGGILLGESRSGIIAGKLAAGEAAGQAAGETAGIARTRNVDKGAKAAEAALDANATCVAAKPLVRIGGLELAPPVQVAQLERVGGACGRSGDRAAQRSLRWR